MTDYTPTTDEVRGDYAHFQVHTDAAYALGDFSDALGEFDRWLAAHDAEVRASVLAEQGEPEWETIDRLRTQIEQARTAWWSATGQGDNGLIYTDRIEDAMDDIWSAIGHAEWESVEENEENT